MPTNTQQPDWLVNFLREAAIKRLVIVHGNVNDIYYDTEQRQYVALPEVLLRKLGRDENVSFDLTGLWDQADGLTFQDNTMRDRFIKAMQGGENPVARLVRFQKI